jgi:copper resistance protein C
VNRGRVRSVRGQAPCLLLTLLMAGRVWAHAFPIGAEPSAGAVLRAPPPFVRVAFDGAVEPVFSTLRVETRDGVRIDRGDARVTGPDDTVLTVGLPSHLPPGSYHVFWTAVARDGHRTEGDYSFTVQ